MATYNVELRKRNGTQYSDILKVATDWSLIANKPSTYTPTAHTHNPADIGALAVGAKAADSNLLDGYNSSDFIFKKEGVVTYGSAYIDTRALIANNITTAGNANGFEYNVLLNGWLKGITLTQSGTGQVSSVNGLIDGKLSPLYSPDGVDPSNPWVLLIEGLPNIHSQTGGVFGWTSRYWNPTRYKIEAYNSYNEVGWVTWLDRSAVEDAQTAKDLILPLYGTGGVGSGSFTKIRITIYDSNGATGANGHRKWGLSEIYFIHPESARAYENANVSFLNGHPDTYFYSPNNKPTASDVGLGNVTNESKATMFTSPTFTGTVTLPNTTLPYGKQFIMGDSNGAAAIAMQVSGENWQLIEKEDANKIWLEFKDDDGLYILGTKSVLTNDSRLSDARTPTSHTHGNISNAGAIGSTSGLVVTTTTSGVLTTSSRSGIDSRSTFPVAAATSTTLGGIKLSVSGTTLTITT